MEEHEACRKCSLPFSKTKKGFNRKRCSLVNPESEGFFCGKCFYQEKKNVENLESGEKHSCTPTLKKNGPVSAPVKRTPPTVRLRTRASPVKCIIRHNYKPAVKKLFKFSGFRNQTLSFLSRSIRRELFSYSKRKGMLCQDLTLESMKNFKWKECVEQLAEMCPTTVTLLSGMLSNQFENLSDELLPTLGMILGIVLNATSKNCRFVQNLMSLQMYNCGCPQKLLKVFNKVHLSAGPAGTRRRVDKLVEEYKVSMNILRKELEEFLHRKREPRRRLVFSNDEEKEKPRGYTFCWDNTQIEVKARHQRNNKAVWMNLWALCYATRNRVCTEYLSDAQPSTRASEIPLATYFPTHEHSEELRDWMGVHLKHILIQNLAAFKGLPKPTYTKHRHWDELAAKSEVINLGVREEDPSTTEGAIRVMDFLSTKVPLRPDGTPHPTIVHCDGGAFERMVSGKKVRAADRGPLKKLIGVELSAQEFHKRGIYFQVVMDKYFRGISTNDRGTLANIKDVMGLNSVRTKVMEAFNHVEDMADLVCEGYSCLLAMHLLGLSSADQQLDALDDKARSRQLDRIVNEMIEIIWLQPGEDEIQEVLDSAVKPPRGPNPGVCCGEDVPGDVVACSNPACDGGLWHEFCATTITGVPPPKWEDWWCSPDCEATGSSRFCICRKTKLDTTLVECSRGRKCANGRWFHQECVQLKDLPTKDEKWYCPTCSQPEEPYTDDAVFQYSKGLLWMLLGDRMRRTAIRTGDGPMMLKFWVDDAVNFWNHSHPKYLILMHRMTAGIHGWLSERLAADIVWNRTVNLHGLPGHNIPMDKYNEFLNNDFKGNLKNTRGKYTTKQTERSAFLAGQVAREVDRAFATNVGGCEWKEPGTSKKQNRSQILAFVEEYLQDDLFARIPGREHSSFPRFDAKKLHKRYANPADLKSRLVDYSCKLDRARYAASARACTHANL